MKITINSKTAGKYRKAFLNDREHLVTEMVPLVADSVMNGGLYPLEEVKNSFTQLDNLPAPNGHPKIAGEFVSAFHPLAINAFNIGGFVRNPRMDDKKVINEFWLDLEIANQSDDGKELIRRIENAEEVGVSTGLTVRQDNAAGDNYQWIARDMHFDHVAILLNEKAAGAHVGTKLQTNQAGLIICNVADQPDKGAASMAKAKTGAAGIISKIINAISAVMVGNATVENIRTALQSALSSVYPAEQYYFWVCDFDSQAGVVFYEVSPRDGGEYKTYRDSYTVSGDGNSATLGGSPVEVIRKTEFVPVGGDAGETDEAQKEGLTVDETKPKVAEAAAAGDDADKAALDAAIKLLESKGYKVAAADAGNATTTAEADPAKVANNAALQSLLSKEQAEIDQLKSDLIANGLAEADVAGLSKDSLVRLSNSLNANKPQDYSLGGGRRPLRVVNSGNAADYHDDYTTLSDKEA